MRDFARLATFVDEVRRVAKCNPVVAELLDVFALAVDADAEAERLECLDFPFEADVVRIVPLLASMVSKDAEERQGEQA